MHPKMKYTPTRKTRKIACMSTTIGSLTPTTSRNSRSSSSYSKAALQSYTTEPIQLPPAPIPMPPLPSTSALPSTSTLTSPPITIDPNIIKIESPQMDDKATSSSDIGVSCITLRYPNLLTIIRHLYILSMRTFRVLRIFFPPGDEIASEEHRKMMGAIDKHFMLTNRSINIDPNLIAYVNNQKANFFKFNRLDQMRMYLFELEALRISFEFHANRVFSQKIVTQKMVCCSCNIPASVNIVFYSATCGHVYCITCTNRILSGGMNSQCVIDATPFHSAEHYFQLNLIFNRTNNILCGLCDQPFTPNESANGGIRTLLCGHLFHTLCNLSNVFKCHCCSFVISPTKIVDIRSQINFV